MAVQLKFKDTQITKPDKILRSALDRLKKHGILVEKEVKKEIFRRDYLPKIDPTLPDKVIYDAPANIGIFSFHVDLMLILKARLFMLKDLTLKKVSKQRIILNHDGLSWSKSPRKLT
jgi:hypothetical protein